VVFCPGTGDAYREAQAEEYDGLLSGKALGEAFAATKVRFIAMIK